jgi:DNA-binding SARP family transcriptional activator/tetratricopeptide (TPR) repeat protein
MPGKAEYAWFGLLGPLSVRSGDVEVAVPAARQRVLLAALVLRAGQVLSMDELAEMVWDGDPPAGARVTLRSYIKRLRQVLGPALGSRIVTRDPGYLIAAGDAEADLKQFETLCRAGGRASTAGAWQIASDLLTQALGLWRGAPLLDIPSQVLQRREVPRLEQLRLQAIEGQIEADLNLGRHEQLVPELLAMAAEQPLLERFHAQLMLALHRCGRRAEALAAYRQARRTLVGELGLEPGPELRRMHERILANDPDLTTPARQAPVPAPRQLPAAVRHFAGRKGELQALDRLLEEARGTAHTVVISAIDGTAGIGKTALAVHWAHQIAEHFPDGQLYVNLRGFDPAAGPVTPAQAIRGFLDALQVPFSHIPVGLEAQVGLYRSLLAGKRMLITLDNARDAPHVRPLLPGSPGCMVVVTSRAQLTGLAAAECAHLVTLDLLTEAEAGELLARRLDSVRVAAEPEAVDELARLCARLPLALSIAAARAAARPGLPLSALATELRDARRRLDALDAGDPAVSVRAAFSWSYQNLSGPAARMFRLLGVHPGPDFTAAAAASLAGIPPEEARQLLDELTRLHVLAEHTAGRFAFHDLLRAYAIEQGRVHDSDTERQAALSRLLDYYLRVAHAAALALNPARDILALSQSPAEGTPGDFADSRQALAWFEAEHAVLLAAIAHAAEAGFDTHVEKIAWTLADFLDRRGHWQDWAAAQRAAVTATRRTGDRAGQARARRGLGRACTELGAYQEARGHFRRALGLYRQLGDTGGHARTHLALGRVSEYQNQHGLALGHVQKALKLFRAIGHQAGEASALNAVGWFHSHLGDHLKALTDCRQALDLYRQLGDQRGEAVTSDSLGYAHHHLGNHAEALTCYQAAIDLFRDIGDRYNQASTLIRLGDTYDAARDYVAARSAWQHALAILSDMNHPDAEHARAKLRLPGPVSR